MISTENIYLIWMIFLTVSLIFLLIHHSICAYKSATANTPTIFLSFVLILLGIAEEINFTLELVTNWCLISIYTAPTLWILFKTCMTYILISRLWITYSKEPLEYYSRKKLQIFAGFVILFNTINIILNCSTVSATYDENETQKCKVNVKDYVDISVGVCDIISGSICLILFVKPLFKISKMTSDSGIKVIAVKQCILSNIAVLSSIIAIIFLIAYNAYIFAVGGDIVVSAFSIILMYKWNTPIVQKCCYCCFKPIFVADNISKLKIVVSNSNPYASSNSNLNGESTGTSNVDKLQFELSVGTVNYTVNNSSKTCSNTNNETSSKVDKVSIEKDESLPQTSVKIEE
eukprot:501633_1